MSQRPFFTRLLFPVIKNKSLFILLFLGLLVRLVLIPAPGFEADIAYWKWWGEAASKGPANALATTSINYPPFFIYVLGLIWKIYQIFQPLETANNVFKTNTFIFLFIVKFPAILSDLISALGIYYLVNKATGSKEQDAGSKNKYNLLPVAFALRPALLAAALYLFNPVIIFDSAFWGQTDSIAAVLVLACLIFLIKNRVFVAAALTIIALETKVQTVVFLPFIYLLILRWHGLKKLWESLSVAALTFLIINLPYLLSHNMVRAMDLILNSSSYFPLASLNAYNIWWLIAGGRGFTTPDTNLIANALSWKTFGMMLFIFSYTLTCFYLWYNSKPISNLKFKISNSPLNHLHPSSFQSIYFACSAAAFSFYMLPTQIHERYIFPIFLFFTIYLGIKWQQINTKSNKLTSRLFNHLTMQPFIYLIILTLSIFLNLHIVLVQNYPDNGLALLNFLNAPAFYLPATLFLSWLNVFLFLLIAFIIIKSLSKKLLLFSGIVFILVVFTPFFSAARARSQPEIPLTSLKPSYNRQDWGTLAKNTSLDKHILSSSYIWYDKGLGSHANSQIDYQLNGQYRTFTTDMGVDVEAADNASVEFIIVGDGKTLVKTPVMYKWSFPLHAQADITGIKTLTLIITDAGDGRNGDHADWLNPKLFK